MGLCVVLGLFGVGLAFYFRRIFEKMGGLLFLSPRNATVLTAGLFVAVATAGICLAPHYRHAFEKMGGLVLTPKSGTLLLIGLFVVTFHVFDEFVNSVFWYLFADVVPEAFMGRFIGLFNVVGNLAGFAFMFFLFRYAETHMQWIYIGIGLVYLVGLTVMCWNVKEGEYPPPDDMGESPGVFKQIKVYVVECFSHPMYIYTFLFTACMGFSLGTNAGVIVFQRDGIQLSMDALSDARGMILLAGMFLAFPAGWAVDKWHPVRITLVMTIPLIVAQFLSFFFLKDLTSFVLLAGGTLVFQSLVNAAGIPMLITLFPKDKYGQFCSCNGMVKSTSVMIGGVLAGFFMDYMTHSSADKFAFRWVYMWCGVFQIAGMYCLWLLYRKWESMGGATSYVPPGSALEKERLAKAGAGQPSPA